MADSSDREPQDKREEYEREAEAGDARYQLRLYVTGMTPRSIQAIANIKRLCEQRLERRYDLEVIDVRDHPELARSDEVVAVPTLVKQLPEPLRRLVGDLSNTERVVVGLDLQRRG